MLRVGLALKGFAIEASDGRIGTVSDFLFDDRTWRTRWLVVDTGKWLIDRKVLIHPSAIGEADYDRQQLHVKLTKAQVKDSPDVLRDRPVSQQMEADLYSYYGWDPLWSGSFYGGGLMGPMPMQTPYYGLTSMRDAGELGSQATIRAAEESGSRLDDGDPHLRSMNSVTGYHVHATDGGIGHVENFLVDDATLAIRYLIVDTRNWWPGAHVLLSPHAVRDISYPKRRIELNVTRDQVKSSPPWNPVETIDEEYARGLHAHYDWPSGGW